jgi:hypothetical protein
MTRCIGWLGIVSLTLLAGCGESFSPDTGVIVTGKIVQGGQPIVAPRNAVGYGGVEVQLTGATVQSSAFCDDSGGFEIIHAGKGVPPGKYKVSVIVHAEDNTDKLQGKLGPDVTTIEVDVPQDKLGGKHDVGTIDVAQHVK